jgi:uncharacterized cupredoxin-like copper-binding protein
MKQPIVSVAVCLLAASMGGGQVSAQTHSHDAAASDAVVIEVDMRDHSFSPANLRIPAGHPVTLVFADTGSVDHEFMAGRTVSDGDFEVDLFAGVEVEIGTMMADHDAPGAAAHDHADAGGHDHGGTDHGTMVALEPGGRTTMTFTLPDALRGEWEIACFLPNHYERGMHGMLTVY